MADGEGGGSVAFNNINHNEFVVFQIGPGRNTVSEIISKPVVAWGPGPAGPARCVCRGVEESSDNRPPPPPRGPGSEPAYPPTRPVPRCLGPVMASPALITSSARNCALC